MTLLAGMVGALIGLVGVAAGSWLQARKEHQHWLRDQKLRAAIDFIGATGDLYDRQYQLQSTGESLIDERAAKVRAQDARSALYLLCGKNTVDAAEALIKRARHSEFGSDGSHDQVTFGLLRDLVARLRLELGVGV